MQLPPYSQFKARLLMGTGMVVLLGSFLLWVFRPDWAFFFGMGGILGMAYLMSLFFTTEFPQRRLAIGISILRMALVGAAIGLLGGFCWTSTCVVFCGFLSYKGVAVLLVLSSAVLPLLRNAKASWLMKRNIG